MTPNDKGDIKVESKTVGQSQINITIPEITWKKK